MIAMVLEKDNAIADLRKLMGATNPAQAEAGTIRKKYAESIEAARKRGALARALKLESIPEDDLQTLQTYAQRLSGTPERVVSLPLQERQD